ncbi:YesN/AraC family two-component response regulator [Chryseobacterium ginsenosidimutans]|nr:YesN/AraC family two-component response regulator [Chryseobacterium ginsenosidimutans]
MSEFFKRQTSESIQQYIYSYRIKLIENSLLAANFRLTEIANEFGLPDVSHLNKLFKKHKHMSPSEYRKSVIS